MIRQSISFTEPNDAWLKSQLERQEFSSKSEVVNDLIRKARAREEELEFIRARLMKAENSGFAELDRMELLKKLKQSVRRDG